MSENLFLIPIWKRPEITRICLRNLQLLKQDIFCIVSRTEDAELCNHLGVDYDWYPNDCLGAKWNFGLERVKQRQWEYVVTLGSDDIVKTSLFDFYNSKDDILINDKIHFVDVPTGRASIIVRARIGAGRRISRKAIEKCKYKLWSDHKNQSLDMDSNANLNRAGFATIEHRTVPHVLGLKSEINIWGYDHTLKHGAIVTLSDCMVNVIPEIKDQILDLLPKPVQSPTFEKQITTL